MNSRERFFRTMHYEKVDRLPFCEYLGYWPETISRWHKEGLPLLVGTVRPDVPIGAGKPPTIYDYFGFDKIGGDLKPLSNIGEIAIDLGPRPRFVEVTLEATDRWTLVRNEIGITMKVLKTAESMPSWTDFPIKTPEDFEKIKKRYDPHDPRRYPKDWGDEKIEFYRNCDFPVGLGFPGLFAQARQLLGLQRLLISFYKNQKFINEIMDWWTEFILEVFKPALQKAKIDYGHIWEDFAYHNGPHISPKLFQEFILPRYQKIINHFHKYGIDIISLDSDGDIRTFIPLIIEGGVNCIWPLEAAANMNIVHLMNEYGKKLRLIGNIDKRALIQGKEAIDKELQSKIPPMIERSGCIPSVDHDVPSDVSLKNYSYYITQLRKYLEKQ